MILLQIALSVLGLVFLNFNILPLLFHPSLFMDEGYYLGASQAILSGDLFLTQYGLDKPYMLPFWPLLGLLAFGATPIGFKFVSFLCYQASYLLFVSILKIISGDARGSLNQFLSHLLCVLFAVFSFSLPVMRSHMISALTEPYIILGILIMVRLVLKEPAPQQQKIANVFFLFFFTKFSVLLWLPIFWKKELFGSFKNFIGWHLNLLKKGWIWFVLLLVFSLTNATKFESILWFNNARLDRPDETLISRVVGFFKMFSASFDDQWVFPLLSFLLSASVFQLWRKRNYKLLWVLFGSLVLHFLLVVGSKIPLQARYAVILYPVFYFGAFYSMNQFFNKNLFSKVAVIFLVFFMALPELKKPAHAVEPDFEIGRIMSLIKSDLDQEEAMLFTNALWDSAPYRKRIKVSSCVSEACFLESRIGSPVNSHQYVLDVSRGAPPVIFQLPLIYDLENKNYKQHSERVIYKITLDDLTKKVLSRLKLGKALTETKISLTNPAAEKIPTQKKPLYFGPTFEISGKYKDAPVSIRGTFSVSDLKSTEFNARSYRLVFKINSAIYNNKEVTDILPTFYGGYSFVIDKFNVLWSQNKMFESLSYDFDSQSFNAQTLSLIEKSK